MARLHEGLTATHRGGGPQVCRHRESGGPGPAFSTRVARVPVAVLELASLAVDGRECQKLSDGISPPVGTATTTRTGIPEPKRSEERRVGKERRTRGRAGDETRNRHAARQQQ